MNFNNTDPAPQPRMAKKAATFLATQPGMGKKSCNFFGHAARNGQKAATFLAPQPGMDRKAATFYENLTSFIYYKPTNFLNHGNTSKISTVTQHS